MIDSVCVLLFVIVLSSKKVFYPMVRTQSDMRTNLTYISPVLRAVGVLRIVARHPLRSKAAEIQEIDCPVRRSKIGVLTIARCGTISTQPVVGEYLKVHIVNVTIAIEV